MLIFSLERILNLKGIADPCAYLRKRGYGKKKAISLAFGRNRMISLDELEQFCQEFGCTPNDLLSWTPSDTEDDYPTNPLQPLRRTEEVLPVIELMKNISNKGIAELERYIQERKGGQPKE